METQRTSRDVGPSLLTPEAPPRMPRPYRLTPMGLAALQSAAQRVKPWMRSTGPRTSEGKARSRLNATKHGERSANAMAQRRELAGLLEAIRG